MKKVLFLIALIFLAQATYAGVVTPSLSKQCESGIELLAVKYNFSKNDILNNKAVAVAFSQKLNNADKATLTKACGNPSKKAFSGCGWIGTILNWC